jgi:hypothetical protein
MENPVDHSLDLGLVNYVQHPKNPNYIVYRFSDQKRAASFEQELLTAKIWFEKAEEERRNGMVTLYGIHKHDYKKTTRINYLVEAKHKKPLIPWKGLRYASVLIMLTLIAIALVGYLKNQEKLRLHNEQLIQQEKHTKSD